MYLDTIIVGAGFSGLYQLHKCRDQLGLKTLVIEEGKEVGGTWYWNKYPGSRCDTESHIYCYTFSEEIYKNWKWKERYPNQKEIQSYTEPSFFVWLPPAITASISFLLFFYVGYIRDFSINFGLVG